MTTSGIPRTTNGRQTRARILDAAVELVVERGVATVSLDDVRERSGTSKSQLYLYFDGRDALLRAVVDHTAELVLGSQRPAFDGGLDDLGRIAAWFDGIVTARAEREVRGGCPLGSLAGQLAEADPEARARLERSFAAWQAPLADGLRAMQARGELRPGADPDVLATTTMASIQGGLLLTQIRRDPAQLRYSLDAALSHLTAQYCG